jgi:Membrane-associating domain
MLFLGCWTSFVAVPYLGAAPIWFPRFAHHFVIPVVEVITMIFWFAGFIALGAELPHPSYCTYSTCRALQAATVFGALEW